MKTNQTKPRYLLSIYLNSNLWFLVEEAQFNQTFVAYFGDNICLLSTATYTGIHATQFKR